MMSHSAAGRQRDSLRDLAEAAQRRTGGTERLFLGSHDGVAKLDIRDSEALVRPDTPMEIEVAWADSAASRPGFARVRRPGAPWAHPPGVGMGTSLSRLEEIRGGPVVFSGFGWDGAGGASGSEGFGELRLTLAPDREALSVLDSDPRADGLYGDHDVSSSHPLVANLGITVATITIGWATPAPDQIRFCG